MGGKLEDGGERGLIKMECSMLALYWGMLLQRGNREQGTGNQEPEFGDEFTAVIRMSQNG